MPKQVKHYFFFSKKMHCLKKKKAFVLIDVCVHYLHHGFQISMFGHVGWMGPRMNWLWFICLKGHYIGRWWIVEVLSLSCSKQRLSKNYMDGMLWSVGQNRHAPYDMAMQLESSCSCPSVAKIFERIIINFIHFYVIF